MRFFLVRTGQKYLLTDLNCFFPDPGPSPNPAIPQPTGAYETRYNLGVKGILILKGKRYININHVAFSSILTVVNGIVLQTRKMRATT